MTNPKIRFKQENCIDFPEWNHLQLNECCNCYDNMRKPIKENLRHKGAYPYYGANDIQDYIDSYIFDGEFILLAEDGGNFNDFQSKAIAKYARGKFWVNNHAHIIQAKQEFSNKFIFYSIEHKDIRSYINGSTRGKLTKSDMWNIKIGVPSSIREQQKIASFFSTLDQKIELNERKLEALEKLKKGLMQKIFNRKIRFKKDDGTDFPDWTVSELGNIAEIRGGGTPSTSNSDYWDGNIQWLTPTEIDSKYVHESNRKITESGLANSSAKLLPIGTILLTTRATIGACSINNFNGSVCTNQGFQSLVCKPIVLNEYVYYAITFDEFREKLTKHASGSTFLEISAKNLKKLTIPTPSLEEQRKIADFLSTIDLQIDLKKKTVSAMRDLKRGFMQQMFV